MTSRDFCYWLQGYFEIEGVNVNLGIPPIKAEIIQKHLSMVFAHDLDPKAGNEQVQEKLDAIHFGGKKPDGKTMRC